MRALDNIPSTQIVAIDIETVRIGEHFQDMPEEYQSAWEYKNKQDGEIPTHEDLVNFWTRRSSLYAEFSKICAVSLAFLSEDGTKIFCKEIFGEDEPQILAELDSFLERIDSTSKYRLAGHAAKYFDYPVLCKRYIINGMKIPNMLDYTHAKPWEIRNLCTNELWKMGGTGPGSSLQALCVALGIPISKVDMVGDEVGRHYFDGNLPQIGRYCSYDSVATLNVVRRMKRESIFQFDEVVYVEQKEFKKAPVLERLHDCTNGIPENLKKELLETLSKKKPTVKDKKNLYTILRGVYIHCDFENQDQDPKDVVQRKEEEIKELLSQI